MLASSPPPFSRDEQERGRRDFDDVTTTARAFLQPSFIRDLVGSALAGAGARTRTPREPAGRNGLKNMLRSGTSLNIGCTEGAPADRRRSSNGSALRRFLLAGGGSGGHVAPGLAVAERLLERQPEAEVLFLCSQRAIDARMIEPSGIPFIALPARPMHLRPASLCSFALGFRRSVKLAARLMRERSFDHVLALGGFVAGPVATAARRSGVPVTLLNLDDPPGRANRWIARRCDRVLTAVPLSEAPTFASRVTGLPIRRGALASHDAALCREKLGLDRDRPTLLVTGASQGATSINALMEHLARAPGQLFAGWQVLHLSGFGADEPLRRAYAETGVAAMVLPFLEEMGLAWGAADLAISRGGANSVGEAAANAVPCIFLPYPYHRDQHQKRNARPLEGLGGAIIIDDQISPEANRVVMTPLLQDLLGDARRLQDMRRRLVSHRSADAAAIVADLLLGASIPGEPGVLGNSVCAAHTAHGVEAGAGEVTCRS